MTGDVKTIELVTNLATHLVFDATKDDVLGRVRSCKFNDIILKRMESIGQFDYETDADEWGLILMLARFKQLRKQLAPESN